MAIFNSYVNVYQRVEGMSGILSLRDMVSYDYDGRSCGSSFRWFWL